MPVNKRALLVGVNQYDHELFSNLSCCVDDAKQMEALLSTHEDGSPNYLCTRLTTDENEVTEAGLRAALRKLTKSAGESDDLLFYFSGHGMVVQGEGSLVTQDANPDDEGFPMFELLRMVNRCHAGSVMVILDCCNSGEMGHTGDSDDINQTTLSEGVTILSASRDDEASQEGMLNSLFTELVMAALEGGAADVRGHVSAASVYAYVEQALGRWQQRPLYKSYARRLEPIRFCKPAVSDNTLHQIPILFRGPDVRLQLDPSWEHSHTSSKPENVEKFNHLKELRNGRLVDTGKKDLYYLALESGSVKLTPLGRLYWQQVKKGIF